MKQGKKQQHYISIILFILLCSGGILLQPTQMVKAALTMEQARLASQKIAGETLHSPALPTEGTVIAWGSSGNGQCEAIEPIKHRVPDEPELKPSDFTVTVEQAREASKKIATGNIFALAIQSDNLVRSWGWLEIKDETEWNEFFTFLIGEKFDSFDWHDAIEVAAGYTPLILKKDGTVVGGEAHWDVPKPTNLKNVVAIASGEEHFLALRNNGTVAVWGQDSLLRCEIPEKLNDIIAITAGNNHSLALRKNGTVVAWGLSGNGQCDIPENLGEVVDIAGGFLHSLALKADGTVVGWGEYPYNTCLVPEGLHNVVAIDANDEQSIALRANGSVVTWNYNSLLNVPPEVNNVVGIAAGGDYFLALRADGRVIAWGNNDYGLCNVPEDLKVIDTEIVLPVLPEELALTVERAYTAGQKIAAGLAHSVALKADGQVVTWGGNYHGQCNLPPDLKNVQAIAANSSCTLALQADGTVVAWGYSSRGEADVPANLDKVKSLATCWDHVLALKENGQVVAWGHNGLKQCNVPLSLKDAVLIAAGNEHSLALQANGWVKAWGRNDQGQCNVPLQIQGEVVDITAGNYFSAALTGDGKVILWGHGPKVPEELTDVVSIKAGDFYLLALTAQGEVVAWGNNDHNQCNVPKNLTDVIGIAARRSHALALKADGTVIAWGNNNYGECNVPAKLNLSGSLTDFKVSEGTLSRPFHPDVLNYTVYVKKNTATLDLAATLINPAQVLLLNNYPLESGKAQKINLPQKITRWQITVNEGPLKRTYELTVKKSSLGQLFVTKFKKFIWGFFN